MNKFLSRSLIALSIAAGSLNLYASDNIQRDTSKVTHIQEIRNATIKVTYADTTFLIDPMFAKKASMKVFQIAIVVICVTHWLIYRLNLKRF